MIGSQVAAILGLGLAAAGLGAAPGNEAADFFERAIRPVLVEQCFRCHSAAADPVKGGLLLDSAAGLAGGGASGMAAVVPGDPGKSRLLTAIRHTDPNLRMPPGDPLPEATVRAFEQWIRDGAVYPESAEPIDLMALARRHWAFHPPQPQPVPEVEAKDWPRNAIDQFVLARLEAEGLQPAPEADRRTLIRRLSFDLIGLPPTPEETAAFEADSAADAYERLVDRLLASPHYGERWARHWLDVARYADTKGYVYGREEVKFTHSHVYRDWVVDALNRDLPYDDFIKLQLAADALTDETNRTDLAAMGFLTLGQRFLGVMPDIIDDRIDTVTRGLMGLTVSCARCHDHKFDPIPIEDYYSLYGVFSASSERTVLLEPDALGESRYSEFAKEMAERQEALASTFHAKKEELETRLRDQVDQYIAAVPGVHALPSDDFYEIRDADDINPTIVRRWDTYIRKRGPGDPIFGPWNRLAAAPPGSFHSQVAALLATWDDEPPADGQVVFAAAADAPATTNSVIRAALSEPAPVDLNDVAQRYAAVFKSVNEEWRALVQTADEAPPAALADPSREALRQVLFDDGSPVRVPQGAIVDIEWMFDEPARVELAKLNAEIDRWIIQAEAAPPYAVTLADKPEMPPARVFRRGNPASPGAEVSRQFLALLEGPNRAPFKDGSGRRELAEAIASPDNPLTARVIVNRVWGWHFGTPIVDTPSDFGTRSSAPSHPALLDWLAREFVSQGWSLKELHRLIVLSATYRQASHADASDSAVARAFEADPENRLLWRFNRSRLDFEALRDAMLFVSGTLDDSLGGRPVEIVQPPYANRRTLYGRVDRQFLPAVYRVFDFPTPDMHSPQRIGTTVPQQALFLMNSPIVLDQARAFGERAAAAMPEAGAARVEWLYRQAYQRSPEPHECGRALAFVAEAEAITPPPQPVPEPPAWAYGYGRFDEAAGALASFTPLPHFTGNAWQGGPAWPDPSLGWAQLTAEGGHPGNDLDHAVVRRWTAPRAGTATIEGRIVHARTEGDGIMARLASSRHGVLGTWFVHNTETDTNFYKVPVEAGDTFDFIVDIRQVLNSDEHLWAPTVTLATDGDGEGRTRWSAREDFAGPYEPPPVPLTPWQKLAHVLLSSNEFLFVD